MRSQQKPFSLADRIIAEARLRKRFNRLMKSRPLEGPAGEDFLEPALPPEK